MYMHTTLCRHRLVASQNSIPALETFDNSWTMKKHEAEYEQTQTQLASREQRECRMRAKLQ